MSIRDSEAAAGGVALARLLQLASPALPVGGYACSEGLEQAVEAGCVHDGASAEAWILGLLEHAVAELDLVLLAHMHAAFAAGDAARARALSGRLLAAREAAELRASDRLLGQALARVLADLGASGAGGWRRDRDASFAALFALAAVRFAIPPAAAAAGYAWVWCENQVAAAVKLVPLGQRCGQRILYRAGGRIPALAAAALAREAGDLAGSAPGLAIASARHEQQRTRLFRS